MKLRFVIATFLLFEFGFSFALHAAPTENREMKSISRVHQTQHETWISTFRHGEPVLIESADSIESVDAEVSSSLSLTNPGHVLWDLVVNNSMPVGVDFEHVLAHALPEGVNSPQSLRPWKGPYHYSFEVSLETVAGLDAFKMTGVMTYYCGAPYRGQGQHLSNIMTSPEKISALIGFTGDVSVHFSHPVYTHGSIASMVVNLETKVRGPLDTINLGETLEVRGDCKTNLISTY